MINTSSANWKIKKQMHGKTDSPISGLTLISGANGNLGSAMVNYFLEHGEQVIGLVHHLQANTPRTHYTEYNPDGMDFHAMADFIHQQDPISTAILTVGGYAPGKLSDTTMDDIEKYFALNFKTAYNLAHALWQKMQESGGGKIFFVGSQQGRDTRKATSSVAYGLSKSLLFQLANIINSQSQETGVQAYVLVPSTIDTPQNREAMPDADFSKRLNPGDIARVTYDYATGSDSKTTVIVLDEEITT